MIADETAGIDCTNCGLEKVVTTKAESESLIKLLQWTKNGDAKCPNCDHSVTYEDYISE